MTWNEFERHPSQEIRTGLMNKILKQLGLK